MEHPTTQHAARRRPGLPVAEPTLPKAAVSESLVRRLCEQVAREVPRGLSEDRQAEQDRARVAIRDAIADWERRQIHAEGTKPDPLLRTELARAVFNELYGVGKLQDLLDDPEIENIDIDGADPVKVTYADGTTERLWPLVSEDKDLEAWVQRVASDYQRGERPFSPTNPDIDLPLAENVRMWAVGFSMADRTHVSIRRHRLAGFDLDQLVEKGMLDRMLADFLYAAVRARLSIVISGEPGSGKTTLLRALCAAIPESERVITIEDTFELGLQQMRSDVVALQTLPGSAERVDADGRPLGARGMDYLTRQSLRGNTRRIIVGEARGREVTDMLRAMTTGAGSMSSIHSKSIGEVVSRLASMASEADLSYEHAIRHIGQHIDLLVHIGFESTPGVAAQQRRFVSAVWEIADPGEPGRGPGMNYLWQPAAADGRAEFNKPPTQLRADKLARAGLDLGGLRSQRWEL